MLEASCWWLAALLFCYSFNLKMSSNSNKHSFIAVSTQTSLAAAIVYNSCSHSVVFEQLAALASRFCHSLTSHLSIHKRELIGHGVCGNTVYLRLARWTEQISELKSAQSICCAKLHQDGKPKKLYFISCKRDQDIQDFTIQDSNFPRFCNFK